MNHDLFCRIQFVAEAYELYFVQKEITLEGLGCLPFKRLLSH
jgi:hypothetical protein